VESPLATTGARSAGPRYSYRLLQQHIDDSREGERIVFLNSPTEAERRRARAILARAERLSGTEVDAAAGVWDDGLYYIAFRNRNVRRATALEEFYHLAQWQRHGPEGWNRVPEPFASRGFTAFQYRELDAAVYLRNEFRAGRLLQAEYDETIANLAHHLQNYGDAAAIRRFLEGLP
jgi:hypothetical protein